MRPQLTVAIDFDDTFTADVEVWSLVIQVLQNAGHRVICVSARDNSLGNMRELTLALPKDVDVILSNNEPKKVVAKSHGYDVDIWIDDLPHKI